MHAVPNTVKSTGSYIPKRLNGVPSTMTCEFSLSHAYLRTNPSRTGLNDQFDGKNPNIHKIQDKDTLHKCLMIGDCFDFCTKYIDIQIFTQFVSNWVHKVRCFVIREGGSVSIQNQILKYNVQVTGQWRLNITLVASFHPLHVVDWGRQPLWAERLTRNMWNSNRFAHDNTNENKTSFLVSTWRHDADHKTLICQEKMAIPKPTQLNKDWRKNIYSISLPEGNWFEEVLIFSFFLFCFLFK